MQPSDRWASVSVPHLVTAVKSRLRQVAFRRLGPHRISPQQFQLLMAIADQDGRCQGDLARFTWMDKPTASRILRTLQDRGLIRAAADPAHGRRVLFHLQPAAKPLMRALQDYRCYIREGIERGFTAEERVQIRALLGAVMANLDRMEAESAGPVDGSED